MSANDATAPSLVRGDKQAAGMSIVKFLKQFEELKKVGEELIQAGSVDAAVNASKAELKVLQGRLDETRGQIAREWQQFEEQKVAALQSISVGNDQLVQARADADAYLITKQEEGAQFLLDAQERAARIVADGEAAIIARKDQVENDLLDRTTKLTSLTGKLEAKTAELASKEAALTKINKTLASLGMKGVNADETAQEPADTPS